MIVKNSHGASMEFECIQAMLDYFGEREGLAILSEEHSEFFFSFWSESA